MKLMTIRSTEIRSSIPVLLLFPVFAVFGRLGSFFIAFISLILHESAHTIIAERLGCRVASIDIQPYGCVAKLANKPVSDADAAAIAAFGPIVSLLLAVAAIALRSIFPSTSAQLRTFISFNLSIALVNLFPVLPLDGGRLLCSLLSRQIGSRKAVRILAVCGCAFGSVIALFGCIVLITADRFVFTDLLPVITGVFIVLSAVREFRDAASSRVKQQLQAGSRLSSGGAMPVRAVALSGGTSVRSALASLSGSGFNIVIVLDNSLAAIGFVEESRLMNAALSGNTEQPIRELIAKKPMPD